MIQLSPYNNNYIVTKWAIALVWLTNGLCCKVLNLVPRHQEIVSEILNEQYARELTIFIGVLEIGMAIWIFSNVLTTYLVPIQITIILSMNILEFTLVPQLLLWGKFNILFAILFCLVIYLHDNWIKTKAYGIS